MYPPFDRASEGSIGIFQYQIMSDGDIVTTGSGCTFYNGQFTNAPTKTLIASQLFAIAAPCLAFIAGITIASEVLFCRFYGSFVTISVLLLAAAIIQGGTFIIFAQPNFCDDLAIECGVGDAAFFSAAAMAMFFFGCIVLCCSPRPDPCRQRGGKKRDDDELPEEAPVVAPPQITASHTSSSVNGTPPADGYKTRDESNTYT